MSKTIPRLLAIAAAGAAAASSFSTASAQSNVTIYGRLNIALESVGSSGAPVDRSVKRETNNRSVIGFRGTEDLGDGYQAIFQIEGALALDTGVAPSIANRETRVGLSSPMGVLFLGHWVTPYLMATNGFDPYYPTTGSYMSLISNGSAADTNNVTDRSSFDRRQQNVVQYWTPTVRGVQGKFAYAFNEGEVGPRGSSPRLLSASVTYEEGPWNLSLAREEHRDYQGPGLNDSGTKLGAAYRFNAFRVAVLYERLRYETAAGSLTRDAYYASGTWQIGNGSIRLAYERAGDGRGQGSKVGFISAGPDTGADQWTLGYDYAFSKRTGVYVYASRIENEARAVYDFGLNAVGAGVGEKPHVLAVGVRHNF